MGQIFDWRTFIDTHSPSSQPTSSQIQKDRQVLLDTLLWPDLQAWVDRQKLQVIWQGDIPRFNKYLQASAFASALRTLNPQKCCCHTTCRPRYGFWLASLDQYIDHKLLNYLLHQDWHIDKKIAYLDSELAIICKQFITFGELTSQQMQEVRLPFGLLPEKVMSSFDVPQLATDYADDTIPGDNIPLILKEAWSDIYDNLKVHLLTCPRKKNNFSFAIDRAEPSVSNSSERNAGNSIILRKFVYETAVAIGGMRDEVIYCLRFQFDRSKPDFEDLLACSTRTICLEPIVALAILLDSAVACNEDWDRWLPIMKQGAKTNRLINDCTRVSRELAEGKMSCVTVLLNSLDYSAASPYAVDNQEVQAAIDLVRQRGATELVHLNELLYNIYENKLIFKDLDYNVLHIILGYVSNLIAMDGWKTKKLIK